jgi:transposase
METGVSYNKQKLHKVGYFRELLATNQEIGEGLHPLLRICRETLVHLQKTESALVRSLEHDPLLAERVERLMTIPAVGPITALTWVLEIGDVKRFSSIKKGYQLLRAVRRGEEFGKHDQAHTSFQAAQQASAERADRGGQAGTATEFWAGAGV